MKVKRIWDRLLNFLFVGLCAVLISACGSEPEIQDLEALKMAGTQEGQTQSGAAVTTDEASDASSGTEGATSVVKEDVYAGTYVDKQGTDVVYSELKLEAQGEGTYRATIGLHRLTTLEGTAKVEGDILVFEDNMMGVKGEITVKEGKAILTITESSFEYISAGDVFEFPEKI